MNLSFSGRGSGSISFNNGGSGVCIFISGYNFSSFTLDFHEVEKLEDWLDDWKYNQRQKCLNCGHERAGCQYHDG